MKIKLLLVGKNKDALIDVYLDEYQKRLRPFVPVEIKYLKENKSSANAQVQKKMEAETILKELTNDDFLVLLDELGEGITSLKFSEKIKTWQQSGKKTIVFLVGGAYGVDEIIRKKASFILSLSDMTFTHQMVRVFFIEQLYRAFTIMHKIPYHH